MSNNPGATEPLPEELGKHLEDSLSHLVESSTPYSDDSQKDDLAPSEKRADAVHSHGPEAKRWISKFFPSAETLDHLFQYEHMGNYVIDRQSGRKIFETMPLYVRVGMHLLFVNGNSYMSYPSIESLLKNKSERQGQIYDQTGPGVKEHIQSFISTYSLSLDELLIKDIDQYPTFNSFFARKLDPEARAIAGPSDPRVVACPSDCRMTAFCTVDDAKQFWIKGKQFSVPSLLEYDKTKDEGLKSLVEDTECDVVVCRLAPQDYHRFHSPVDAKLISVKDITGELYTVNPQAVNENLNVFTLNKRSVMLMEGNFGPGKEKLPVAVVAIGAMLVGSIGWSKKPGDTVKKGEDLGWFQYGGSTVICIFPTAAKIKWDDDLIQHSKKSMETLVKVGMHLGEAQA